MALKMNVNLNNGINLNDAYIKIIAVGGTKENAVIEAGIFVDVNFTNDKFIEKRFYNFKPSVEDNSENWIKQGYEYLKTLDEYSNSIDDLEE